MEGQVLPSKFARLRQIVFALPAIFLVGAYGQSASYAQPVRAQPAATRDMPQREREFIDLLTQAKKEYDAAETLEAKKDARMNMQLRISKFMAQSQEAHDWTGTVQISKTTREGDGSITIAITPEIVISTARNREDDPGHVTLIPQQSPLYAAVDKSIAGQPIVFSATIIRFLVQDDEAMVSRPHLFAKFSALQTLR